MRRARTLILVPLILMTLIVVAVLASPQSVTLAQQPAHTFMHLNCPPGSHGKPRFTGVGQSLEKAREEGRAARSLDSRAMTAR